ncbi:hypothetical protein EG343_22770 [Chryseobacterium nakagawai]|uniref:Uncharacterized protein n=1 Tax=Chryseobacterium nakagawai TaxID=1241982 RepID=A0AAD0YQ14_CHRNA|nr:hypothetical protein EG343_22770 [Chryseobacterium nakagawai]
MLTDRQKVTLNTKKVVSQRKQPFLCFNFFCFETKIQDLDFYAKNKFCSLKIFLMFTEIIFLTLRTPVSVKKQAYVKPMWFNSFTT